MPDNPRARLQRFKRLLQRFLLLLLVYAVLLHFTVLTAFKVAEYIAVSRELAGENAQYRQKFHEYSRALWEAERLQKDKRYQFYLVKGTHYYTENDEELVLIAEE